MWISSNDALYTFNFSDNCLFFFKLHIGGSAPPYSSNDFNECTLIEPEI